MDTHSFFLVLITISYMNFSFFVFGDVDVENTQSFNERIVMLQTETHSLCTHIQEKLLVGTKNFKMLMHDAHIYCPNMKEMEISLINVETMADKYYSFVSEQLDECQELLKMLTKGLENGGLVVYYLKEGNYSLVTNIIDNWHVSFTKFHATFYLTDTPLEIILKNNKIFYYDSWLEDIKQSISRVGRLVVVSLLLSSILVWIGSNFGIIAMLSQLLVGFHRNESPRQLHSPETKNERPDSDDSNPRERTERFSHKIKNRNVKVSTRLVSRQFYIILVFTIAVALIAAMWICYPTATFFSSSARRNWYPDATAALETLRINRDNLQSNLSHQIHSIEELQRHASMYHDKIIQTSVNELIDVLGDGVRQVSKELSDVYMLSEKMPSRLRRAYKSIEGQARKIGKLSEVTDLLNDLNNSAERYEKLQRTLHTAVIQQHKVLPILKKQTQAMQALVRENRLIEIGRIIDHHQHALIDIDGIIFKVDIQLKNFIQVISDEHVDGTKKMIESLSEQSVTDQIKVMITGAAGAATSTIMGAIAVKTGYAMVTLTASVVAGPALGVAGVFGGIGMIGLGGYWAADKFDQYKELTHFQNELAVLETERVNLLVAMEKVHEGIKAQQTSLELTQSSLTKIANHCSQFSGIPGFTLNKSQRSAINDELLNAITEYNRMMAVYSLFMENMDNNDRALPPA